MFHIKEVYKVIVYTVRSTIEHTHTHTTQRTKKNNVQTGYFVPRPPKPPRQTGTEQQ